MYSKYKWISVCVCVSNVPPVPLQSPHTHKYVLINTNNMTLYKYMTTDNIKMTNNINIVLR